jgi:ABC-2 type transport system permease protein
VAGINSDLSSVSLSRQQFATIAWLRWRIFVNTLRGKGATGELVARIVSYPVLAIMILGPSIGAGTAAYYLVSKGMDADLAIPLWIIFGLWQFIGVSTSSTGPSFDLATLVRFPMQYRDYFLMRLTFGLMDPPTLAGICCLVSFTVGVTAAAPAMLPWAALVLFVYAAGNVLFSRMIYSWLERWLAQRRTRELFTILFLIASIGFQFVGQFVQRVVGGGHHHHHSSPLSTQLTNIIIAINWWLPPGLTASAIAQMHSGSKSIALGALAALLAFTTAFLIVLHLRYKAQFLGENLSETPANTAILKSSIRTNRSIATTQSRLSTPSFLSPAVAACLAKEFRLLLRSGPRLYTLIMPVVIVFLFSLRAAGLSQLDVSGTNLNRYLFSYGCAYTQLILVNFLYNALGTDGAGVQFYFMAPLRFRDVMLAKNLLILAIFLIEVVLIYGACTIISTPPRIDLVAATIAWTVFALFVNLSIGNVRSITSPKIIDAAKLRRQNVSGINSFISVTVVFVAAGLGASGVLLCLYLGTGYWPAAAIFAGLAVIAIGVYILVLNDIDSIASRHVEDLTRTLTKA